MNIIFYTNETQNDHHLKCRHLQFRWILHDHDQNLLTDISQVKDEEIGSWLDSNPNDGHGEFYNSNPYNPYGMTMREPVENTVKRGSYLPYRIPKDSIELAAKVKNPIESSDEVLKEAKVLYERYCIHCHGEKGMGDGLVGQVYKGVTAYNSRAVKDRSEGHIFHVITHGKGRMWGHGSQISIED